MSKKNHTGSFKSHQIRRSEWASQRRLIKIKLAEAQNWRCAHCYCILEIDTVERDHVIELALDGDHDWYNWVASCRKCNRDRSAYLSKVIKTLTPEEKKELKGKLLKELFGV